MPAQGRDLGRALQAELGAGYSEEIHFIGYSLGTLINAAAANYLHGDRLAQEKPSYTPWLPERTHMTLLDHTAFVLGSLLGTLPWYDGPLSWLGPMPKRAAWADNYISLTAAYYAAAVNILLLQKTGPLWDHGYPIQWYGWTIVQSELSILGFRRSFEIAQLPGVNQPFPPTEDAFQPGTMYWQDPSASDPLVLTLMPPYAKVLIDFPVLVNLPFYVAIGAYHVIKFVGDVAVEILDSARQEGQLLKQGFDHLIAEAGRGLRAIGNIIIQNKPALRLRLRKTGPQLFPQVGFQAQQDPSGEGVDSMAWIPIAFPEYASAMAFDFSVEGYPGDALLVCGIGTNNLFTLEAKYIPTNTVVASPLNDVSQWAGSTNEQFFGFMGGTSTNLRSASRTCDSTA